MNDTTLNHIEAAPTLIDMPETPDSLNEGWRLFLTEIRALAADSRRRRVAAADVIDETQTQQATNRA